MSHLVEQSLPLPEVRGSNPDISQFYTYAQSTVLLNQFIIPMYQRLKYIPVENKLPSIECAANDRDYYSKSQRELVHHTP